MTATTAVQFEKDHGALVRSEYSEYTGYEALCKVLGQRQPPIVVSEGVVRQWLKKSIKPADAVTVSSTDELQEKYGSLVKGLASEHATPYRLCKALRSQTPPLYVTDGIAKQWFKKYGTELRYIDTAGHLEMICGARIREHDMATLQAPDLQVYLRTVLAVEASQNTCNHWRTREWSSSGKLLCIEAVESAIGERLRLPQYADKYTEEEAPTLAELLLESQPSIVVLPLVLRQWHAKYHPASGPLHIEDADALDVYLGEEIRREYAYFTDRGILAALMKRRQSVLLSRQVVTTWLQKYAPKRINYKRTAPVWGTPGQPLAKRPAVSDPLVPLVGAAAVEAAVGERYRREVTDRGLGIRFSVYFGVHRNQIQLNKNQFQLMLYVA